MSLIDRLLLAPTGFFHMWGYALLFLFAFLEAIPLVGTIIPGHIMVMFAGFLARGGVLNLWDVMLIASLAAILGDLAGYLIGRYGAISFARFPFLEEKVQGLRTIVRDHPGKSLIIGRFNALSRPFAPFLAGTERIPLPTFMFYNAVGGIAWAVSSVLIGYVFGASFELISQYVGRIFLAAVVVSVLLVYLYRFARTRVVFAQYSFATLGLHIVSLYLLAKTLEDVVEGKMILGADHWVASHVITFQTPTFISTMVVISGILSPTVLWFIAVGVASWFWRKRQHGSVALILGSFTIATLLVVGLKSLIQRARPEGFIPVIGYSFPSGHATIAAVFFSLLLYLYLGRIRSGALKTALVLATASSLLLVGFSRIVLNVHWLSDVIAGYALGFACVTACIILVQAIFGLRENRRIRLSRTWAKKSIVRGQTKRKPKRR